MIKVIKQFMVQPRLKRAELADEGIDLHSMGQ